jgi:hypothetical protein
MESHFWCLPSETCGKWKSYIFIIFQEREKQARLELTEAMEVDRQTALVEQALREAREKQQALSTSAKKLQSIKADPVNTPTTSERVSSTTSGVALTVASAPTPSEVSNITVEVKGSEEASEAKNARLAAFVGNMIGDVRESAVGSNAGKADS